MTNQVMSQAEFSEAIETLLNNPETRKEAIAMLDRFAPGIAEVEIAFMYEADGNFAADLRSFVS